MTARLRHRLAIRFLMRGVPVARRRELADELLADLATAQDAGPGGRLREALWLMKEARSIGRAYREDARGNRIESVWRDLVHAVRGYARTPLFTIVAVVTIALGIGANSAIFSLVNAVLLRPLPYPAPKQLVRIYQTTQKTGRRGSLSPPNYFDLKDRVPGVQSVAAFWSPSVTLTSPGADPEKVLAATCSYDLFATLDVAPHLGRAFTQDDDQPGARTVAVIGYRLWQRRFGGDASVVGRDVMLDGSATLVVGVMPPAFEFPLAGTELWVPLRLSHTQPPNPAIPPGHYREYRILSVIARLRPDVTPDQVRAQLVEASLALEAQFPDANHNLALTAVPLHDVVVGPAESALLILWAAVGCVLLIACANVSSLLLVRATTRSREVTIRLALGATRARLVRQMLTESVTLALVGGAVGLVASRWALGLLIRVAPAGIPRLDEVRLDGMVVAVTAAVAVLAGLAFGLAPALQARAGRLQDGLRRAGRSAVGGANRRTRNVFVLVELGLSLALVIVAGLLIQSLVRVQDVDLGFRPARVVTVDRIELPRARAQAPASALFFDDLLTKVRALPTVVSAGATLGLPLDPRASFYVDETTFSLAGEAPVPAAERPRAPLHVVTPDYFTTIGVPVLRGRAFTLDDRAGTTPVVVLNEAMARRYWPNRDPVGQHLTHDLSIVPGQATTREVVGIVGDVRHFGLEHVADAQMYIPHAQMPWPSMALVVRTTGDPVAIGAALRQVVWSLDRTIPVPPLRALDEVVSDASGDSRFRAWLLGLFAATALLLACIGLYGTMAYSVEQRTSEVALRIALGASGRQAGAGVLREGLVLVGGGLVVGSVVAFVAARADSGLLYGISAADPTTFIEVPIVVGLIGWLACYLPIRRAARINPLRAMRYGAE
ncbi:MAG: ABC transporter permease [Vicinamibacterales bacterium]